MPSDDDVRDGDGSSSRLITVPCGWCDGSGAALLPAGGTS